MCGCVCVCVLVFFFPQSNFFVAVSCDEASSGLSLRHSRTITRKGMMIQIPLGTQNRKTTRAPSCTCARRSLPPHRSVYGRRKYTVFQNIIVVTVNAMGTLSRFFRRSCENMGKKISQFSFKAYIYSLGNLESEFSRMS